MEKGLILLSKIFISKVDYDRKKGQSPFCPEQSQMGRCTSAVCVQLYTIISLRVSMEEILYFVIDTDSNRFVLVRKNISWSLSNGWASWFDEGVSFVETMARTGCQRREIYKKYVQILLEAGKAYTAFGIILRSRGQKRAEIA